MLQVVQAFRVPFAEVPVDGSGAMEAKLQAAIAVLADRDDARLEREWIESIELATAAAI
jgi:hypothetical protein